MATSSCQGLLAVHNPVMKTLVLVQATAAKEGLKSRKCAVPVECSRTPRSQPEATWSIQRYTRSYILVVSTLHKANRQCLPSFNYDVARYKRRIDTFSSVPISKCIDILWLRIWVYSCAHFVQDPIPAPGKPIPPSGTKFCGCQGDGVCGQLGQHCCCYDAKKDDISCQSDPVTSPAQCCGDPAKDCKKDKSDVALPWL